VPIQETISGFEEIVSGKLDHIPEQAFYMKGNLDEVKEHAEKLAKENN
jgi:F-type H+-transporting ATPase subunit beta